MFLSLLSREISLYTPLNCSYRLANVYSAFELHTPSLAAELLTLAVEDLTTNRNTLMRSTTILRATERMLPVSLALTSMVLHHLSTLSVLRF